MAKIRTGFVSNSSSSSFIIGVKNKTELTVDDLIEAFKVPNDSLFFDMASDMANFIIRNFDKIDYEWLKKEYKYYIEDKKEELGRELTPEEEVEVIKEDAYMLKDYIEDIRDNKIVIYQGHASHNEGDGVESVLGNMSLDIDADTLIMKGGGDY